MLNEVLAERFRITGLLGSGGMGQVWAAEDERMRRDVAVKVVHPHYGSGEVEARDRFEREVQLAARLTHQNIVTVHDWGEVAVGGRQTLYLVMELVDGVSLDKQFKRPTPTSWPLAVGWAAQIAQALHAAHREGVVHRDIKPANVLLTPEGAVKILDFGVAKFLGDTVGARKLTAPGTLLGTPAYMSPEQIEATGTTDPRSDLYSLGCLLYHAVTGSPPFDGDSQWAIVVKHQQATPAPPGTAVEGLPPALNDLILNLLAKRPEDRPDDAAAVHDALAAIIVDQAFAMSEVNVLDLARLSTTHTFAGRLVTRAWQLRERAEQDSTAQRERAEREARHLLATSRAEAARILDDAREEAQRIVAEAKDAVGIMAVAPPQTPPDVEFEMFVKAAGDEAVQRGRAGRALERSAKHGAPSASLAVVLRGERTEPPRPQFDVVRRGYEPEQVHQHILKLINGLDWRLAEADNVERRFIEERLKSRLTAHSSTVERKAVLDGVLDEITEILAPGLQHLAARERVAPAPSDLPPFELVRRGYDRLQVDSYIKDFRDEEDRAKLRAMELQEILWRSPSMPRNSFRY